ncbi:MAG: DUF1592 domain-containing protein, partial [Myxococcales bacterium]|nr:DUF1592 domain-containing protein [Myxococcales bacterium]
DATADIEALTGCEALPDDATTCAQDFIGRFGRLAFRRPLAAEEEARFLGLFESGMADNDFPASIGLVLQAILVDPAFHFRFEVGEGAVEEGTVALSGLEVASRLSFLLWSSSPDEALLDAAEAGELDSADGVRQHAERMLGDPRARRGMRNFFRQWLRLDRLKTTAKLETVYPEFDEALARDLRDGALAFADYVMFDSPDGSLRELFTGELAAVTPATAPIYGIAGPAEGLGLFATRKGERAGIVTDAAILSAFAKPDQSSPIARGVFVREVLLCQTLESPPEGLVIEVPPLDPTATTRERFAAHSTNPTCARCHKLIDPIGFAFERYDGIGRYRESENGLPIDTSGQILDGEDATGNVDDALDLARSIVESEVGQRCFATQLTRYALGHSETKSDKCTAEAMSVDQGPEVRLRDLVLDLVTRATVLRRPAIEKETCQ